MTRSHGVRYGASLPNSNPTRKVSPAGMETDLCDGPSRTKLWLLRVAVVLIVVVITTLLSIAFLTNVRTVEPPGVNHDDTSRQQ